MVIFWPVLLLGLLPSTFSSLSVGSVHDSGQQQLLGKFCFGRNGNGTIAGTISGWISTPQSKVVLALYDDEHYQNWPSWKRPSGCDCRCKLRYAKTIIPIEPQELGRKGAPDPFKVMIVEKIRPTFWFVVLARCSWPQEQGVMGDFKLEMVQANESQLSVDQSGLYSLYMVATYLWFGILIMQAIILYWHGVMMSRSLHPINQLFAFVLISYFVHNWCMLHHWHAYAEDGVGNPAMREVGHIAEVVTSIATLLLLLLLGKGWAINTNRVRGRAPLAVCLLVIMGLYLSLSFLDYTTSQRGPDHTNYIYERVTGWGMIALQLMSLAWFSATIWATIQSEHGSFRKRFLYQVTDHLRSLTTIA
jgi:hypothetical protein